MKEKIMSRLPFIYTYYTIIIFVTCIYNLAIGNTLIEIRWFIELFAFLVIFVILDQVFSHINFKSFFTCAISESAVAYVLLLVFSYFFKWITFAPEQILRLTILFLIIVTIGISYMNYRNKLHSKELNELIKKQNG